MSQLLCPFYRSKPINPFERLNQPASIVYVSTGGEVLANVKERVGKYDPEGNNCNCVSELAISSHGSGPGVLQLGDIYVSHASFAEAERFRDALESGQQLNQKQLEQIQRADSARSFLSQLTAYRCKEGVNVTFVVCGAGQGEAGERLSQILSQSLGEHATITLFPGTCGFDGDKAVPLPTPPKK